MKSQKNIYILLVFKVYKKMVKTKRISILGIFLLLFLSVMLGLVCAVTINSVGTYTDIEGDYSLDGAYSVFVSGDYAYTVSENDDTLAVFNISAHGNSVPVGTYTDIEGDYSLDLAHSVFVSGDYAYTVSSEDDTLAVFNISAHGNPVPVGTYNDSNGDYSLDMASSVFVSGDYAYTVSYADDTLAVFNISAHGNPVPIGTYNDSDGDYSLDLASSVFVSGDYAYTVSSEDDTLAVFNISAHGNPVPVGTYTDIEGDYSLDGAWSVFVSGDYAYTVSYLGDTLAVFNISAQSDTTYPSFSNYWDNNATLTISGTGLFNVTVDNTNGTVLLEINNTNITATNISGNAYNASYSFTSNGTYSYKWHAWGNGTSNNYNVSETISYAVNPADTDNDGLPDSSDPLLYNESNVTISGVTTLNITVGGNATNGSFSGEQEILFYDQTNLMVNFSHNFSTSNLDLSQVTITKTSTSLIVNLSGQLQSDYNKTLYLTDNSFTALCVKDAEISSISEVSSACTGTNETDMTSCLGGSYSSGGINCTDEGTIIKIENLRYSAVRGTPATTTIVSETASSGSGGCLTNWICSDWSSCVNGNQTRNCTKEKSYCYVDLKKKPVENQSCFIGESEENNNAGSPNKSSQEVDSSPELKSIKNNKYLFLGIILIIVIGVVFFFVLNKKHRKR